MSDGFSEDGTGARSLYALAADQVETWLEAQPARWRHWLKANGFKAKPGRCVPLPDTGGAAEAALLVLTEPPSLWDAASARQSLHEGVWQLHGPEGFGAPAALGWALADYRFKRYKREAGNDEGDGPQLLATEAMAKARHVAACVALSRDLINTPANDLGPGELAAAVRAVADEFGATVDEIVGDDLLRENFPAVHAVGRASARTPRLVDLTWGAPDAVKLTLVGKGVVFDTGGLDLKPSQAMRNMKKDMGGAAVMLGLARAVMALRLPVRLRLLIPTVENSVNGDAFRPGDIIRTRKGLSVEIGNTDAEGRLILADALTLAGEEKPDLLIDAATLTGAARVALGPDLPALFCNDDALAAQLSAAGVAQDDPLWRLPLHKPYREMLDSTVADIENTGQGGFAGAITAALFLQEFVPAGTSWAHLDLFAWTPNAKPGRPKGGEASALRALTGYLCERYAGTPLWS